MKTYSIDSIAALIDAEVIAHNSSSSHETIAGIGTLQHGGHGQIGFLAENKYQKFLTTTELSAVIVDSPYEQTATQTACDLLLVRDVKQAWRQVVDLFAPQRQFSGIHPQAIIDERTQLAAHKTIGAGTVIGQGCSIAQNCIIEAGSTIGCHVTIGEGSYIASGVHIGNDTVIGNNAYINSGAVIGSRGFGFSYENNTWQPIAQLGHVVIGNDVEIGANTTIDRGAVDNTVIGDGVKLDNLIQVGHNVVIGDHTIIAGCCVIAGSTKIGKHCLIGGASVINGHIDISDYTQITGHSSITKSIKEPGGTYSAAFPALPSNQWNRMVANVRRLNKK